MGIVVILLCLGLLILLAYRGISVLLLAPILAALAAGLSGLPVLASYTHIFMGNTGGFIITYFPLFLLGAIFGRLMEVSGAAQSIGTWSVEKLGGRQAILAIILSCGVLTYGGVSLFVVAFAVFPVAAAVFEKANLPARLIPGTIALGAFTFTMTALPGTPSIQNAIPMPFFGTTAFAAPILGIVAAVIMLIVGYAWLRWRADKAATAGEGYADSLPAGSIVEHVEESSLEHMPVALAVMPIVLVILANLVLSKLIFPAMDLSYLADAAWGGQAPKDVIGIWSITVSLTLACLAVFLMRPRKAAGLVPALSEGAEASVLPIFNTASLVGFGAIIAATPAFDTLRDLILGISPGNPLISLAIAVNILAGITGSASGGMSIALETLGEQYLELATAAGISPEVLHRVTAVATGGLDALPHNGAVVTLLAICNMTHAKSYIDIFIVALVGPIIALAVIIALATIF